MRLERNAQERNKKLLEINSFGAVQSVEELAQGVVLRTNRPQSEVRVEDTVFHFDSVLYLVTPNGEYDLIVSSRGTCPKAEEADIDLGYIETINAEIRPVRISLALSVGPYVAAGEYGAIVNADAGVSIAGTHFVAASVNGCANTSDEREYLTDVHDAAYPDTMKDGSSVMAGGGITYGYRGLRVRKVTVMPRITLGYWRKETATWYGTRWDPDSSFKHIKHLNRISYEQYFAKPGVEIRIGYNLFGFRAHIDTFVGESWGPTSVSLGIVFRLL
ncbi:MAG: hypothetical protein GF331_18875 [Chitinivibrionales bacterium]|nr:hypothetical protein [Chitinivibrionales bacterium]